MAISNCVSCILKEWAPLTDLLNKLPTKPNLSIFSGEVKITCVDILTEFVALGTNYGMAYWYDRTKRELQRLRCENSNVPITSIKVLSTVDYMLACGGKTGNISIFQIPKTHPDWIPENLKPKNKCVERYTVTDLHKSPITALEWSKNGMKLFSGDKNGIVVLTEIDFYMHICKSLEILNESYEIVQLSYCNPRLVISTTYRSIICEKVDKWNVVQVGQKDRKILGAFGGLIQHDRVNRRNAVIYCTRPGLRIWVSDCQGNVQKTLLFKELLSNDCTEVQLLNPAPKTHRTNIPTDINFGKILPFYDNLLVTYNSSLVFILDAEEMTIVSKISQLRRVLDVACYKDEIFILEEDRSLIRISTKPESSQVCIHISSMERPFFRSSIKDLTAKLQPSSILSAIPPVIEQAFTYDINEHTDGELVMNAEEAIETTGEQSQVIESSKRFENIEDEGSIEIIYKHKKHKKKSHNKDRITSNSLSSNSSAEDNISIVRPTMMNLSTVGVLPDLRSPQSIQNDIECKEKMLEDVLNFNKKISLNFTDDIRSKNVSVINIDQTLDGSVKNMNPFDTLEDVSINEKSFLDKAAVKLTHINKNVANDEKPSSPETKVKLTNKIKKNHFEQKPSDSRHEKENEFHAMKGIPIMSRSTETPACVDIPNGWNLSSVRLKSASSDPSLSDWEII